MSQGAVAKRVGWSLSKVQRIESGDVTVSGTDLLALLNLYGVTDAEEIEQLTEESRISRRQRWWTVPEYRQNLTPASAQLIQFEAEATAVRIYHPVVVPGLMQTPAYAKAVLDFHEGALTEQVRTVRLEARMRRRRQFLETEDGPHLLVILDEAALMREIGGLQVMAEQLTELAEVAQRPDVNIRIVPLDEGALLGMMGPFTVLDLGDDDPGDAVLYRESWVRDGIEHSLDEVGYHRRIFENLWQRSLDEAATIRAILAAAASLRSRADRM